LFTAPKVLFVPGSVVLMGSANVKSAQFVVTITPEPKTNEKGLLNLQVAKVKIGAMNITPLAKIIAKKCIKSGLQPCLSIHRTCGRRLRLHY
jgi:uncharacterized protein YpmS